MNSINITELRFGRNIGTEPMSADRWSAFQADVVAALEALAEGARVTESWVEVHLGTGSWTAEDGSTVDEESAVVTLYWSGDLRPFELEQLELDASIYANRYRQDAIAVVHGGRSTLVKAKAWSV